MGNIVTVLAGFLLGSQAFRNGINGPTIAIHFWLLLATLVGIFLVMASGCVFNNYIDRDIDGKMERTKHRVLVTHKISLRAAFIFATALAIVGFLILCLCTNVLAASSALVGFIFYVVTYSLWGKRHTVYGTFIGAIAGATPPVVGYAAASGRIDGAAAILFLIMLTWQMPHFFAIAIRRREDYAAAGIPVMPVRYDLRRTKISMAIYIIEFIIAASLLSLFGYAGPVYLSIALVLGIAWLALALKGFWVKNSTPWAKQMFLFSLVVMMALFITIMVGAVV